MFRHYRSSWRTLTVGATLVLLLAVAVGSLIPARGVTAAGPQEDLKDANAIVQTALKAARAGDLATAKREYERYENAWFTIEDGIRERSRDAYRTIERYMADVSTALAATPMDGAKVTAALTSLDREQRLFIEGKPASSLGDTTAAPAGTGATTIRSLLVLLQTAQTALSKGDYPGAVAPLKAFQNAWLDVEGEVKTRSAGDYRQTESDMALAYNLATQNAPEALSVVNRMTARLEPYQQATSYGIFDASIILLREGLEALLVLVALLAFLQKSGNPRAQGWIWSGAGVGLFCSILLGFAIQVFFSAIINPNNRELMEGVIGLVAAAMLIYVSYWLHSNASLAGYQQQISERTTEAIQGGRLFGLAVLAFLAVFREGAETALFFLGMVGNITIPDLLMGLAIGFAGLAVIGFLMVGVGIRIPLRPFFTVASVLVFYLCFKFVGTGIHGLQIAGILPTAGASYLPAVDALGMYNTWPTTVAQLMLLAGAVAVVLIERAQQQAQAAASIPREVMD